MGYVHWQNLNEGGSGFGQGRAWLHTRRHTFHTEWHFGKHAHFCHLHLNLHAHGDDNVLLAIGLPFLFGLWFGVSGLHWKWLPKRERQIGISIFDGYINLDLWCPVWEWSRGQPRWWAMHVNVPDLVFGKTDYTTRDITTVPISVAMPEGDYAGTCRIFETTWKRPRWPWPKQCTRADVDLAIGIPIPGKGENDYDLDDDAIYGGTYPCDSPKAAVNMIRESALRDRMRR